MKPYIPEIRIGVGGNIDAGKSTFVGVITKKDVLDNGRGYARSFIFKYQHEKDSGRTSALSQHYIRSDDKIIEFTDLAGHEKYFKTTIQGISGCMIDYVAIIINANTGIQTMTREHINLVYSLRIPMFIVYTKIDMCPKNIYDTNLKYIETFYKKKMNLTTQVFSTTDDISQFLSTYNNKSPIVPIFPVSSVTGEGYPILRDFIMGLEKYIDYSKTWGESVNFIMSRNYSVPGIGLVLSGVMKSGTLKCGDVVYIGPNYDGFVRGKNNIIVSESTVQNPGLNYYKIVIKSIHNNFRESVDCLRAGESGCVNIKSHNNKLVLKRGMIKKGMRILDNIVSVRMFEAKIKILHNPSTITKKYQPIIHCSGISQTAQIVDMDKEFLRSHDEAVITFKFMYKPEYIEPGSIFIFREGLTKGIGKIMKVL